MKYHKLKNFFIASATALLYQGYIVPSVPVLNKVLSVLFVFVMVMLLFGNADKELASRRKEKRDRTTCEEKTKSA